MQTGRFTVFTSAALAAVAATSMIAASMPVPDLPDLMIKARTTFPPRVQAPPIVSVLYVKGARARREQLTERPPSWHTDLNITQCDERRMVMLSADAKTYAYLPIVEHDPRDRGGNTIIGIPGFARDIVDTGERRAYTHYTARHLITTVKRPQPPTAYVTDGWYVDLPDASCWQPSDESANRGGFPIEEIAKHEQNGTWEIDRQRMLVELSEAPLDAKLFDVPADYLPALPTGRGGWDMRKQDTLLNRLGLYWQSVEAWANYWLGTRPTPGWGQPYND